MKLLLFALSLNLFGQIPVRTIVTAEAPKGAALPLINREDVIAHQGKERVQVSEWVPCVASNAALELFLLIDDASDTSLGTQLSDLKQFVASQPPTTAIGVAYMHNGIAEILQPPTPDHDQAARVLRLPLGNISASASPYLSLSDLVKKWPASPARHEVVMISSGVDYLGGPPPSNPYLDSAIADAQRAGVITYPIYTPGAGRTGRVFWSINWGQMYLSKLGEETGGESYMLGFSAPVSFQPYLADISQRLTRQYRATVMMKPAQKSEFQPIKFTSEIPRVELIAPARVWVPAPGTGD